MPKMVDYIKDDFVAVMYVKLGKKPTKMRPDRRQSYAYLFGNLLVAFAMKKMLDNLILSGRQ